MNNSYHIKKTNLKTYPYIVFSTSYINPMDEMEALKKDLQGLGVEGIILFDLLLSHGNNPDRFYKAFFNGDAIVEDSLKNVLIVPKRINNISLNFYHSQQQLLNKSVLTKPQKYLISKKKLL